MTLNFVFMVVAMWNRLIMVALSFVSFA